MNTNTNMNTNTTKRAVPALLAAALATMSAAPALALDAAAVARLDELRRAPDSAGQLVYRGAVHPLARRGEVLPQVFNYERRVGAAGGAGPGYVSSHITRATDGEVIVVESARFAPGYELQHFEAINKQSGYRGSVTVTDGRLHFVLHEGGKVKTAVETVRAPVVSGPSLHGFIARHWDALAAGERVPVRFIVLAKMETYGFEIYRVAYAPHAQPDAGRTTFAVRPTSWLVRLALDTLHVEFDTATRNVARYTGRVPPMREVDGKLRAFDAQVDYTMHAATYL